MSLLIKAARLIDPAADIDGESDILINDSRIEAVGKNLTAQAKETIDAKGKIVLPGLVDMHVHLREPGREDKETLASGTCAALKGGVTSVLAMPNTNPAIDSVSNAALLKGIIEKTARCNVYICAAITVGRQGKELVDICAMKKEGALAISDDGASVDDEALFRRALETAAQCDMPVICHSEDRMLSAKGVVNAGLTATRLGLRGISRESEYKRVARDVRLAQETGSRVHIAHVSCKESVEIIAEAKRKGAKVTCETCPHYFSLSEEEVLGFDTNMKMNPPLRSREDVEAIRKGLKDGTIDVISSDHAPHTENEKDIEFERAEFGVIGLETELAVAITELVRPGIIDWWQLVRKMSLNPAGILGIKKGTLSVGSDADVIIIDADREWLVEKQTFVSKSKNSAFIGRRLKGLVEYSICSGKIKYKL